MSRQVFVSLEPTVPQLARVLDDVVIVVPERFFQYLICGFGLLPAEHDSPQYSFRIVEYPCRLCTPSGPKECLGVSELLFQLRDRHESYPYVDVSVEIGKLWWFPIPIGDG